MPKWNYGDAYKRHPIGRGVAVFDTGSKLKVHNIFDPLPGFMHEADLLFIDPPWNLGNLNSFYTKAGRDDYQDSFPMFYRRLFQCIGEISPRACLVEVGKQHLADFIIEMRRLFRQVTFYNSTYYHRRESICYIVHGSRRRKALPLDYMDEEDAIAWVCENLDYNCIGDLCMGQGLVALGAHKAGRRFVGTELNHKRLSVTLERLTKAGANYTIEEETK